jgi:hypothetical protein
MKHKQGRHGQAWAAARAKGMLDPPLNTIILGLNIAHLKCIMSFSVLIRERECLHGPNLEVYIKNFKMQILNCPNKETDNRQFQMHFWTALDHS